MTGSGARPQGRRKWLLALFSVVLSFTLLEAGARLWFFRLAPVADRARYARPADLPLERHKFLPHPYLCYCLNPAYRSEDGLNRHNRLGFRGEEIDREKPPGGYRIACLGGSTTYTEFVPDHRLTFPAQLQAVLREKYGHPEVEVVNAGVPGYTSWESLINLQLRVLDLDPDLVVIYPATNDVRTRLVPPETYRRDNTGYRRAWHQERRWWDFSVLLHWAATRVGWSPPNSLEERTLLTGPERWVPGFLADNPPDFFADNLRNMVVLGRAHGAEVLLVGWAHSPIFGDFAASDLFQEGYRQNNAVIRRVATEQKAPFYDFPAEMPTDREFWRDGRHVNERGARLKAELFAAFIHDRFLAAGSRG